VNAPGRLSELSKQALDAARERRMSIVTAESCTAGRLAALLSEALHGGFVTYTKLNKTKSLGVSAALLKYKGAVCCDVALAMAEGALARSPADIAVSITGVAGPDPDEDGNPVGLVCIAVACHDHQATYAERRYGDLGRDAICERAMGDALTELIGALRAAAGREGARNE